ncbi:tetratricopeptide repeat-containing sensor histidine kinase [Lacinutrix jangbogonensis]|uniref:tetratricopeptide repeat-containing sensor histidine kinase n=1 Tax=Lacinutrix jangbogonensis TaxID=1469557 RepID=UPI00053E020E|nr:tetratricopeptide repeat-containing sensor histidine kinase [Lacinutrix jangbogonensis]
MKSLRNSFLFFLPVFTLLCFNVGFAQHPVDSLDYHSKRINLGQSGHDLSKAYQFFKRHLANNEKINYKIGAAYDLYFISIIDFKTGFYGESETFAVRAIAILDKLENSDYNTWLRKILWNHLGKLYHEQKIYSEAINKYNEALGLTKKSKDTLVIYNNISNILKDQNKFKAAEIVLLDAVDIFDRVTNTSEKARVLNNLGLIKLNLNKEGSLSYLLQALELRKQLKDSSDLYSSYTNLSQYYTSKEDSLQAITYALKAYNIADFVNRPSYREDALKLRLDLEDYSVIKEYRKFSDSLALARKQNQNKFALLKYDLTTSEFKSQEEKAKSQLYKLIAVLIFISGISFILILKSRHKKQKLEEVYKTEARISEKIHDEVANDVYHVMTKLQIDSTTNESVLDDLESIYTKTRDISRENNAIVVTENFEEVLTDLLLNYKSGTTNVITKNLTKIDWQSYSKLKKMTIYRVLQELMVNMRKHSEASFVIINFEKSTDKLIISYSDNGVGSTLKKANGLENVENRISTIKGTVTFETETNKGFKAIIKV